MATSAIRIAEPAVDSRLLLWFNVLSDDLGRNPHNQGSDRNVFGDDSPRSDDGTVAHGQMVEHDGAMFVQFHLRVTVRPYLSGFAVPMIDVSLPRALVDFEQLIVAVAPDMADFNQGVRGPAPPGFHLEAPVVAVQADGHHYGLTGQHIVHGDMDILATSGDV